MKKTVLTFGLISGAVMTAMMFATLPFTDSPWLQSHSMVIGYTTMVLSFMLVFFGIRSYRENVGGTITFGRAFAVGILITLISSVLYVITWEIMYFGIPSFGERFMTMCVAHIKNSGASPEAIQTSPIRWQSGDGRGVIRERGAVGRAVFAASVQLNRYASGTQPGRKSWNWEIFLLAWR